MLLILNAGRVFVKLLKQIDGKLKDADKKGLNIES